MRKTYIAIAGLVLLLLYGGAMFYAGTQHEAAEVAEEINEATIDQLQDDGKAVTGIEGKANEREKTTTAEVRTDHAADPVGLDRPLSPVAVERLRKRGLIANP